MQPTGNVWWVGGQRNTGKSYECLQIAEYFRTRELNPKRTIILDWTNNQKTYGHIKEITLNDLDFLLPQRASVRVVTQDVNLFWEKARKIRNACIIVDDATSKYKARLPKIVEEILYCAKNNSLELIFQFHTIRATAPAFQEAANMFVIKATVDSKIKNNTSLVQEETFAQLVEDCRQENKQYSSKERWATRILDQDEEMIFTKNLQMKTFVESYKQKIEISEYLNKN